MIGQSCVFKVHSDKADSLSQHFPDLNSLKTLFSGNYEPEGEALRAHGRLSPSRRWG